MGRPAKMSATEVITDNRVRGEETDRRRHIKAVQECMKRYECLPEKLYRHMVSLGYTVDGEGELVTETRATKMSRQLQSQEQRLQQLRNNSHAAVQKQTASSADPNIIHGKYGCVADFSVAMLKEDILPFVEPTVCTTSNLRGLRLLG